MELNCQWKVVEELFSSGRKFEGSGFILNKGVVVHGIVPGQDPAEWTGAPREEVEKKFSPVFFERESLQKWLSDAAARSSYLDQTEWVRDRAREQMAPRSRVALKSHFLLRALAGGWRRVIPNSYGLFLRFRGARDLLLVIRRGDREICHEPDLSSLEEWRKKDMRQVVRYLGERHIVPVQGAELDLEFWEKLSTAKAPWRSIAMALLKKQIRLHPFRFGLLFLVLIRAAFRR